MTKKAAKKTTKKPKVLKINKSFEDALQLLATPVKKKGK